MKQYLLSVTWRREPGRRTRRSSSPTSESTRSTRPSGRGRLGVRRRTAPAVDRDRRPGRRRRVRDHRRPVRRNQGAARRVLGHLGRDLDAALECAAGPPWRAAARSRSGRSRTCPRPVARRRVIDDTRSSGHFRREYGRCVATLVRLFGDIDLAEEAVQEAFTIAVDRWPATGLPPNPGGWITTTASNRAIDQLRREAARHDRSTQAALLLDGDAGQPRQVGPVHDDRLRLIFTCCHPALAQPPGRTHLAAARRPADPGDRAGVPGARAHHGAADRPGEEEDQGGAHPLPGAGRR